MGSYGSYETNREIGSAYGSAVYSARKAGEATDAYAVKVYAIDALVGDNQQTRSELDPLLHDLDSSFANRIELQKKAANNSSHLAPILESGQDERGIWYATRLYPRSLQKIIAGRVLLTRENLFHMLRSIARGTLELKTACERSHGNLKPSNVLISAAPKLSEAEVVLCDPLPGGGGESARYEKADLRAIGEMLLQLVRRRELNETSDWLILPIESSPEWTQLFGKEAPAWLALCNRLLDPNLSADSYSLEKLDQELAGLAPKPAVSPKALAIAAGILLLGVAGALIFFLTGNKGKVVLTSDPPGALLYIEGREKIGPAPQELKLAKGDYRFEARFGGFSNQLFQVTVEGRGSRATHNFKFDYGSIVINSQPPGASIQLGGTNLLQSDGKTPARTPYTHPFLRPGEVLKYELSLDNKHETAQAQATVPSGGQSTNISAKLLEIPEGEVLVSFSCNLPRGEKITLSGSSLASFEFEAPFSPKKSMPVGNHTVTAKYRDWPPKQATFTVEPNKEGKVDFQFDFGRVMLEKGEPAEVRFAINGKATGVLGQEPILIPLQPGPVTIWFDAEGFERSVVVTNLASNARLTLIPKLAPVLGFVVLTSDPAPAMVASPSNQWQTVANRGLALALAPGTYQMTATFKGLKPVAKPVLIEKGKTNLVDFTFAHGKVRLTSNVPGAEVRDPVNDNWVPLETTLILPEGPASLTARDRLHGLADETIPVDVKGKQLARAFEFKYGTVILNSIPPVGVEVRTNGVRSGDTPLTNYFVKAGGVKYELFLKDLKRSRTVSTNVAPGATCLLSADLSKEEAKSYVNSLGMELLMVNEGYYLGRWEVSEEQYKAVMGSEDTRAAPANVRHPVTGIGWSDATNFCAKLTARDNQFLASHALPGWQYAIPGEKEWLAAAGPSPQTYASAVFAPMALMNVGEPSRTSTNEFGFYDMFGNVAEWCLGSNQEKITLGGSVQRARPSRTDFLRISEANLGADAVLKGNKVTGFRCVLRAKAGP